MKCAFAPAKQRLSACQTVPARRLTSYTMLCENAPFKLQHRMRFPENGACELSYSLASSVA
jgi:hypothetical protein